MYDYWMNKKAADPTPGQEYDSFRMAFSNPGVAFTWDDQKHQYVPIQYDQTKKTNVPYTGEITRPAPLTRDQRLDRKMYIRSKAIPPETTTQATSDGVRSVTQGSGTFRFGRPVTNTNSTAPARQPDTKIQEGEWSRF